MSCVRKFVVFTSLLGLAALVAYFSAELAGVQPQSAGMKIARAAMERRLRAAFHLELTVEDDKEPAKVLQERASRSTEAAEKLIEHRFQKIFDITKGYDLDDRRDDLKEEDSVKLSLGAAQTRLLQWRLDFAETHFDEAADKAKDWLQDLKDDEAPIQERKRAARVFVESLIRQSAFDMLHGNPPEAITELQEAVKVGTWLAPPSQHSKRSTSGDLSLLARAEAGLGKAFCLQGGGRGSTTAKARKAFTAALQAVAEAEAVAEGTGKDSKLANLAMDVHLDHAECLHRLGELPEAWAQVKAAMSAATVAGVAAQKKVMPRLARLRGLTLHEDGHSEEASRFYADFLDSISLSAETLDDPDSTLETFGVMQDMALTMLSQGRTAEALKHMESLEALQSAADKQMHLKNKKKFLAPKGDMDIGFWTSRARTHELQAQMLIAQSDEAKKPPSPRALQEAQKAVQMLRTQGQAADLANALNMLGNVELASNRAGEAERSFKESLEKSLEVYGESSVLVAAAYHNLGAALDTQGEREQAVKLYRQAFEIQKAEVGLTNPDTAETLASIADCLERLGSPEAKAAAVTAAEAAAAAQPEGHKLRVEAEERLTRLEKASRAKAIAASEAVVLDV